MNIQRSTPDTSRSTWMILILALAVAAAAVWAHAPCLQGGFLTNMDDDVYMAAAKQYGGLTSAGVHWAFTETLPYYQPLPRLTHLFAYTMWVERPTGHHAVNLALHAFNAALATILAWILLRFGMSPVRQSFARRDDEIVGESLWQPAVLAGFVGLVFAVHPLQAESVAWIAGRTQLLCATLILGCVLAYVHATWSGRNGWRWVSGVLFIAAWLTKPIVVTLPIVLLVLDWFPLRRHLTCSWGQLLWEKAWMFAVSVVLTLVTFCFASGKAMLPDAKSIGLVLRVLIAERAIVFYVWKLIWPAWLSPFYPLMGTITLASAEFFAPALLLTAACLGVWFARRRAPALAAAWMAYIALVLPVLGLTQFGGESVANRHMYVAMLPLVLVAAGGGAWLCRRAPAVGRAALIILAAASLVYLGERTRMDVRMWHDDETFWRNVLRWYPDYAFANWKVAEGAIARRDFVTGLPCAERALEGFPKDNRIRGMLGLAYLKTHSYEAAVRTLEPLVRADTWMPAARYNLACAYARLGSNAAAFAVLRELLSREPRFIELAKRDRELAGLRGDPQFAEAIRGPAQ